MSEFDGAELEYIWVELDVQEDDEGLTSYSGLAESKMVNSVLKDSGVPRFLRLDHVYWTRSSEESEWKTAERKVMEYGKGRYGNHQGSIYIRTDRIVMVSPLRGGADMSRKYLNK